MNGAQKGAGVVGFVQDGFNSEIAHGGDLFLLAVSGGRDHRDVGIDLPQRAQKQHTIHDGHHDVSQHDGNVVRILGEFDEGFGGIRSEHDPVTIRL